ncbi:MAG: 6,7-dimethyl-8-ribityllumazine synthase [Acidimicrobiia bacterium]|nr:6,7-dimethyl-8-ribityllumazine synthase [Acidimicrobiia bacterium]
MGIESGEQVYDGSGLRIGVVVATFNSEVTGGLLTGALLYLHDVGADATKIVEVPGAFEIPLVAKRIAESKEVDAVVALGAVVKGDTDHYDHVAHRASEGLMRVTLETGVPVTFGILTSRSAEDALQRSAPGEGNKGAEAAAAAVGAALALKQVGNGAST